MSQNSATAVNLGNISLISTGCHVTWKRDPQFRSNHEPQMSRFFKAYGYGPFFVRSVKGIGPHKFVTISTESGDVEVNEYYLQYVQTYLDPIDMATD